MATKMSSSSSRTTVSGWRRPTQRAPARQRGVEAVAAQRVVAPAPARAPAPSASSLCSIAAFARVQLLARLPALGLGQLAERLQQRGERPRLAAEEPVAQRLEGGRVRRRGGRGVELRPQRAGLLTDGLDRCRPLPRYSISGSGPRATQRGETERLRLRRRRSVIPLRSQPVAFRARRRGRPALLPQAVGRAAFADWTSLPKAAVSVAAISASDLRSSAIPAPFSPAMNWL